MTKNISISHKIRNICPNIQLGVLQAKVTFNKDNPGLNATMETVAKRLSEEMTREDISKNLVIADSRLAYKSCGKDPARYRLSAEAMLRRVVAGKGLYRINNVVDTLNLVSIQTGYSIGGYDTDKIDGDIVLDIAMEGTPFDAIGRGTLNITNLPVLCDNQGAFGTPTSDSTRTMVDENIKDFLMVFYNFGGLDNLNEVLQMTKSAYVDYCSAQDFQIQIIS